MLRMRRLALFASVLVLSPAWAAEKEEDVVARILDEGKNRNQVMRHLTHLTQKIGPRLTGSPQLQRACEWTAAKFREYGLQNVHLEQWGEIPVGFERGQRQHAMMVSPVARKLTFTTPAWTPGTKGKVRGPAVLEPRTMAEFERVKSRLKGAWVIARPGPATPGGRGFRGGPPPTLTDEQRAAAEERAKVQTEISKAGIAGRVNGSGNDRVTTGGSFRNLEWGKLPTEVRITVTKPDHDAIVEQLDLYRPVELEFDIENRFIKGPVPVYNVIADIPGTERPDEMVIISGHLDSWNGPGSQGSMDNGTGTMAALEAARILMATGAKPKRTIRFIMWTGEEQGLLGSRAYVEKHKANLDKISAVFVDDGGTNYQGGVACVEQMAPMLREAMSPVMAAFPDLPQTVDVGPAMPRGGGSDHASFNAVGVPGFFWHEKGRADYGFVWHTQNDRLEYAIPEYLVQSSTNSAVVAFKLANADTLLPRVTAAQQALAEQLARAPSIGGMFDDHDHDHDHDDDH